MPPVHIRPGAPDDFTAVNARAAPAIYRAFDAPDLSITQRAETVRMVGRTQQACCDALLDHDILTGTSNDPEVLRILAPLVLEAGHVEHLAQALDALAPRTD